MKHLLNFSLILLGITLLWRIGLMFESRADPTEVPKGSLLKGSTLCLNPAPTNLWLVWLDERGELHTFKLRQPVRISTYDN